MDIYSLAATHVHAHPRPGPMKARAEDRYYATQIALPHLRTGLLGSIPMMVGVILLLGTSLI
jgi:hypothetical protein